MPGKKSMEYPNGKPGTAEWYKSVGDKPKSEFVNYELSADEHEELRTAIQAGKLTVPLALDALCSSGNNVSVKLDLQNRCYATFVIACGEHNPNTGLILTGRGGKASTSLLEAYYKHLVFDGKWPR